MNRIVRLALILVPALSLTLTSLPAFSQYVETKKWFLTHDDELPDFVREGYEYQPEVEPEFREVPQKELAPPKTLRQRIEALVFGIQTDIPPEYDPYGYQMRRFMAHIGGPMVMSSPQNLEGQLKNIKQAKKFLREWQNALNSEVRSIQVLIDEKGATSAERSLFKLNSSAVYAFIVDAGNWIRTNQKMLEYLLEIGPEKYSFQDPIYSFRETKDMKHFRELYLQREEALKVMVDKYAPFRMMIY